MKKVLLSTAALLTAALAFTGIASATAEPGQVEGGNIYWAKNVTQNGAFVDPANATCNDTVQFRVRVHNPGPSPLTNVNVKATLPSGTAVSHSSTVTITSASADPSTTTDTAGVNLSEAAALTYINGSTELLDANGTKIATYGDTIFTSGVTIETVGVSTQQKRFVQFSVKVKCPEVPKKITVCELATKKIVTIDEKDFDASKHSKDLSKCKEVPPTKIKVCELSTKKIIEINEKDFDASKHSKDLSKCKEVPPAKIKVCELATKKIVEIKESDFNSDKYSKDLNDCKETPVPGKIQVCEISTKSVITINENEFDSSKHSSDLNDCGEVLSEETPEVIPATGPTAILAQILGAGSLAAAGTAYVRSRKLLG